MKLTLGKKLGLGFGVILCLMVFNSALSYLKSSTIKQNQDFTFELRYPTLETARKLQRDLNQSQSKGRQVILAGAKPARREITSNIAGVAEAAESTSRGATDTQKAAQQLVETSTELRRLVEQFKIDNSESAQRSVAPIHASKRAYAGS